MLRSPYAVPQRPDYCTVDRTDGPLERPVTGFAVLPRTRAHEAVRCKRIGARRKLFGGTS